MNRDNSITENLVEVKESLTHGKGIFALQDIPEEKVILVIEGEVITEAECIRREEEEENVYIFWNGDDNYIDATNTSVIKYINHDCNPNCYVDDRDENTLFLISMRPIVKGEEITMDYGYDEIYDSCNCNECRDDEDEAA